MLCHMRQKATLLLVILAASLAACSGRVTTDVSEPHAILEPQQHQGGDATWPVRIVEIDGVNQDGARVYYPLAPGRHDIVVEVDEERVREGTLLTSARRSVIPIRRGLTLEMVGGKRYIIAAHPTGKVAEEWMPVLVRIEEVNP